MAMKDLRNVRRAVIASMRFPIIDNAVFRMHFLTAPLLLTSFVLLSTFLFLGEPINCYDPSKPDLGVSKVVETYCLLQENFTLPGSISKNVDKELALPENNETFTLQGNISTNVAHPGNNETFILPENLSTSVDKVVVTHPENNGTFNVLGNISSNADKEGAHSGINTSKDDEGEIYLNHSLSVCLALFIQTIIFLLPYRLWLKLEGGRLQSLVRDLTLLPLDKDNKKANMNEIIDNYLRGLYNHKLYIVKFFICEVLNFINVVFQILIMGSLLGWKASTYGLAVVNFFDTKQEYRDDPIVKIFPQTISCTYNYQATSGDELKQDFLCNLQLNKINELICALMWFGFVFLAILSGIQIVYRVFTIVFPQVRHFLLKTQAWRVTDYDLNTVLRGAQPSDWFFLYQLNKNVDYLCFEDFIESLAKRIDSFSSEIVLLNSAKA